MTIYTVALGKGGTTKTTTAAELAFRLAATGRRVLAIDSDEQGNLSTRLGLTDETEVAGTTADVMRGMDAEDAAIPSPTAPGVDVLAGTPALNQISGERTPEVTVCWRDYLPTLDRWDDVVIDTPPALSILTQAGLTGAEHVIVPVPMEGEAIEQTRRLVVFMEERIRKTRLNRNIEIGTIIPTKFRANRSLDQEVLEVLQGVYGAKVTVPVRETVTVRDAYLAHMPVGAYDPGCTASLDYAEALAHLVGGKN